MDFFFLLIMLPKKTFIDCCDNPDLHHHMIFRKSSLIGNNRVLNILAQETYLVKTYNGFQKSFSGKGDIRNRTAKYFIVLQHWLLWFHVCFSGRWSIKLTFKIWKLLKMVSQSLKRTPLPYIFFSCNDFFLPAYKITVRALL